jgi:hypothetical protein
MSNVGHIEIRIEGKVGNIALSKDSYDINDIKKLLDNFEHLLFPNDRKNRPLISYDIQDGSVKHIFKTTLQFIIGFNALIGQVSESEDIDFLEINTAKVFEMMQDNAIKNELNITLKTSIENSKELLINKDTNFYRSEVLWIDAEFYFYGKITNMGGKDKANFHIVTEDFGTLIIQTPKQEIEKIENNPLYKSYGIRATGKQNSETGEIDKSNLKFISLITYEPRYDAKYLQVLRDKANWLKDTDADAFLKDVRGYDA